MKQDKEELVCKKCGSTPAYKDIIRDKKGCWDIVALCKTHIKTEHKKAIEYIMEEKRKIIWMNKIKYH